MTCESGSLGHAGVSQQAAWEKCSRNKEKKSSPGTGTPLMCPRNSKEGSADGAELKRSQLDTSKGGNGLLPLEYFVGHWKDCLFPELCGMPCRRLSGQR